MDTFIMIILFGVFVWHHYTSSQTADGYINNQDFNWPIITNNTPTTDKVKGFRLGHMKDLPIALDYGEIKMNMAPGTDTGFWKMGGGGGGGAGGGGPDNC